MENGKVAALAETLRFAVLLLIVTSSAMLLFGPPPDTYAGAFRILDQSASATGQSNAFTAQADDASAIYYNPAGMTQLRGIQLSFGATFLGGKTSYTSPSGSTTTGNFAGSATWPPPSNFYLTANLKDLGVPVFGDLVVGIGVNTPFGTKYQYPDNAAFNSAFAPVNAVVTRESLEMIDIKPTIAYRLTDQLSFGLGADIYTFSGLFGEGQYEYQTRANGLAPPNGLGLPAGTHLELNGKDTAVGFNASVLYTPIRNTDGKPLVNVGFIYRSQVTLHLDGELRADGFGLISNSTITLVLPQVYTLGFAVWPARDDDHEWKLEMDIDYTGWKSVRDNNIYLANGTTIANPKNWRSGYTLMIGTEYKWLRPAVLPEWEIALRGGYWNSQTPVPDQSFSPTVPDADNHSISVGLGMLCKGAGKFLGLFECGPAGSKYRPKAVGIDLAYQALLYETRTVSGSNHFLTGANAVDGRYQTLYHVGAINLRVNF